MDRLDKLAVAAFAGYHELPNAHDAFSRRAQLMEGERSCWRMAADGVVMADDLLAADGRGRSMMEVVHIAGQPITIDSRSAGQLVRQLCGWCGFELIDYDTTLTATLEGDNAPPATWEVGALVAVSGGASYVVEHIDGENLPANSCTFAHRSTVPR